MLSELKSRPQRASAEDGQRLEQLRQRLARVETAVRSLGGFLASAREVEADGTTSNADWERDHRPWKRLPSATEQSQKVDGFLKAAGMTLAADGATVTCRDLVTSLSQRACGTQDHRPQGPGLSSLDKQGRPAKRTRLEKGFEQNTQGQEEGSVKASDGEGDQRVGRGSFQVKSEEREKGSLVQRRLALLVSLQETKEAAEQLRLQEPSLPALQHR